MMAEELQNAREKERGRGNEREREEILLQSLVLLLFLLLSVGFMLPWREKDADQIGKRKASQEKEEKRK